MKLQATRRESDSRPDSHDFAIPHRPINSLSASPEGYAELQIKFLMGDANRTVFGHRFTLSTPNLAH